MSTDQSGILKTTARPRGRPRKSVQVAFEDTPTPPATPDPCIQFEDPQPKVITLADVRFRRNRQSAHRLKLSPAPRLTPDLAKRIRIPLQQLQYRSYKYDIPLYHYYTYILPLPILLNTFRRAIHGYHHTYIGPDPLHTLKIPKGDDPPPGRLEVAYLRNVFQGKGSAIGFRDKQNNRIEWLCFVQPSESLIEQARGPCGEKLFELIGVMPKDGTGEQGNREHREWFESVPWGIRKPERLVLTWKNKERDRMEAIERGEQITKKSAKTFVRVRTGERPVVEYKIRGLKGAAAAKYRRANMQARDPVQEDSEEEDMTEEEEVTEEEETTADEEMAEEGEVTAEEEMAEEEEVTDKSPEPQVLEEMTSTQPLPQPRPQTRRVRRQDEAATREPEFASSKTLSPCPKRSQMSTIPGIGHREAVRRSSSRC